MATSPTPVTILLARWRQGDSAALDELTGILYERLRQIAERQMAAERGGHTLSPSALLHEAYLRLSGVEMDWKDRAHFLAMAAREMRRVLIDHARSKKRQKRGGDAWQRVTLPGEGAAEGGGLPVPAAAGGDLDAVDILAVHAALDKLAEFDPRKAKLVELTIFGGLTNTEAAHVLEISEATLFREWRLARAWLKHELKTAPGPDAN